jgi:patatin-like phospholipase/acyl hydrolase
MAFDEFLEPNGEKGKRLTILSIDGGGVRGIIPAEILKVLEDYLKNREGQNTGEHYLWEYFDMIAGTSSGGLITAMITTPKLDNSQVPTCNASQVVEFFEKDAARIFPATFT